MADDTMRLLQPPTAPMLSDELAEQVDNRQGVSAQLKFDGRRLGPEDDHPDYYLPEGD